MTSSKTSVVAPGELITEPDPARVASTAAARLAAALRAALAARGRAALALSGGTTPRDAYALLAREPGLDWSKVDVFWVDERAVPPTDDRSNYRWAKATLVDGAKLAPERVHRMLADAADLDGAARAYEIALRARVDVDAHDLPVLDVVVLGIGDDGHTASIFPGDPTVDVADRAVMAVPSHEGLEPRLTLTPPVIQSARVVFVLVVGAKKTEPLERAWAADGDAHRTPARIIRGCRGAVTWIIDLAAHPTATS